MRALASGFGLALAIVFASVHAQDKATDELLTAVVAVQSKVPSGARSAATLGSERRGSGALIRDGWVLTIGYLVIEADSIQVTGADGRTVPATLAGYDHASGFGLLKLVAPLAGKPIALGDSAALGERDAAMVASGGGMEGPTLVQVVSRRAFSGSWEYLLESAIFTSPPVRDWSGASLIGATGELLGIGSLVVPDAQNPGAYSPGNLFVPVELLKPILEQLIAGGRRAGPARPWLGVYAEEMRGRLFVTRVSPQGPAERAGVKSGDILLALGGEPLGTLAEFYRKLWARGAAGAVVPLRVLQGAEVKELSVRSIDRLEYFKPSKTY